MAWLNDGVVQSREEKIRGRFISTYRLGGKGSSDSTIPTLREKNKGKTPCTNPEGKEQHVSLTLRKGCALIISTTRKRGEHSFTSTRKRER